MDVLKASILIWTLAVNYPIKIIAFAFAQNAIFAAYNTQYAQIQVNLNLLMKTSQIRISFCDYNSFPIQQDSNRSRSFTLSGNSNMAVNSMIGSGTQGSPNTCTSDWLLIGCARVADRLPQSPTCEDRLCGGTFNAEISSMDKTVMSMPLHYYYYYYYYLTQIHSNQMKYSKYVLIDFRQRETISFGFPFWCSRSPKWHR